MASPKIKKISTTNTKQEMLDAYNNLVEALETKKENEIKASEKIEEKQVKASVSLTDSLTNESINKKIAELKFEFGTTLSKLHEKIEEEFSIYLSVKKAVEAKEKELNEIFDIQKNAQSLYALIEAQKAKKDEFTNEMEEMKDDLEFEIEQKRKDWDKEKTEKEIERKERDKQEQALRARDKEEYNYAFNREKQLAVDKFESEKAAMIKELAQMKETADKELVDREKNIKEAETELKELRKKAADFPNELSLAIDKSVKDATERIIMDSKHKEEMLIANFDGEKKSLIVKIESLEKTIKEQNDLLAKYSSQLEKSYYQIQDIATKAVTGSQNKTVMTMQPMNKE